MWKIKFITIKNNRTTISTAWTTAWTISAWIHIRIIYKQVKTIIMWTQSTGNRPHNLKIFILFKCFISFFCCIYNNRNNQITEFLSFAFTHYTSNRLNNFNLRLTRTKEYCSIQRWNINTFTKTTNVTENTTIIWIRWCIFEPLNIWVSFLRIHASVYMATFYLNIFVTVFCFY